ncbi:hypothetical protein BDZ45DRAFT_735652 [Acephala macrosclerotiorum]|nr:hypothetical protein BDZ45DRAFT_735652 [Acephala macrosclerotiorum]
MKSRIDAYFEFSKSMPKPENLPESFARILRRHQTEIKDSILTDRVFPPKEEHWNRPGLTPPGDEERFYLLKRQPIFCGILACRAIYEVRNSGLALCKVWGTISHPAQLYMALRNKEDPVHARPMMEKSQENPNRGAERRTQKLPKSKKGPRGLREDTVLDKMFRPSAGDLAGTFGAYDNGRHMFDIGDFEGLLGNEAMLAKLATNPEHKILKEIWTNRKQMTPMQMLLALRLFVSVEVPKLRFDYFKMHEQSIKLLRMLTEDMHQDFLTHVGPWYLEDETELMYIALYVITTAAREDVRAELYKGLEEPKSRIPEKTACVFEEFIKELE